MASISFAQVGSFNSVSGGPQVLENPTSLQFGPDGRLYVAEQNGTINAFTVSLQDGEFIATDHEVLLLADGSEAVKSILNHNDDGTANTAITDRQVTGLLVTGTAENPVLYVSSSDPRIAEEGEVNLDTNSGIVTQLAWNGTDWEAVDIVRGLPRSEENHSVNGLALSPDGNSLYLAVGGNTNNGAPSLIFSFTNEYALSGTVLEIDLTDIDSREVLTDPLGGQNGTSRQFIYDLPTLDDPTVPNDGAREGSDGLDVAGPFGGNDGFNQAILPADAPLQIFADGLRNNYDLVLAENGNLFTVDNGSNDGLGGDPIVVDGEVTTLINEGGIGNPEPLFLLTEGDFFGHPNPVRANQDLALTVFDNNGNPDPSLPINTVPDLSELVPAGVDIPEGFLIDPSRFTGDPTRLAESGVRVPYNAAESPSLANLGSSSNGLAEYTADAFDGALEGALLVTQFNGNVTLLNVNESGTALEPLIGPGPDEVLGTADDEEVDANGILPLISNQSLPLDVTTGPDGTIFVAEFGASNINVFAPSDFALPFDTDVDNDGILNVDDPFSRDATNGGSAVVFPNETLIFDFDANQDQNVTGPIGFSGGLTGVQIDGTTDFEAFFQEPSSLPNQLNQLDNVRFATAAGGGTTVIENVANGTPLEGSNDGEFLFQTGVTIAPNVDTFTVSGSVFNPATAFTGPSQRIGNFIGTGDQSNFLAVTVGPSPDGEIQIVLEDNDVIVESYSLQANDLLTVPNNQQIFFDLAIDTVAATATPTVTYETGNGNTSTVSGTSIDLAGTAVLGAILGNNTIQGQQSGLAVGLFSSNAGQSEADTFQAIFNDIEVIATSGSPGTVLYRVNAGGPEVAATDGGPNFAADPPFLVSPSNQTRVSSFPAVEPGASVGSSVPGAIFDTERADRNGNGANLEYAFAVPDAGDYQVRLFVGNGFDGTSAPGQRVFDVAVEGSVPGAFSDIDLSNQFGHLMGGVISGFATVTDGTLNIEFLGDVENPLVNGIEIIQLSGAAPAGPTVTVAASQDAAEPGSSGQFLVGLSEATDTDTVVTYTIAGTAAPGDDYTPLSGTVTIPAGQLSAAIDVVVLDDGEVEGSESATITLSAIAAGDADVVIGGANTATVAIIDDDAPQVVGEDILYRVNAGGPEVTVTDGGPNFAVDTPFLVGPVNQTRVTPFPAVEPGATVGPFVPGVIFDTERADFDSNGGNLEYAFPVPAAGNYQVRLFVGNGFNGTSAPGQRVFDVAIEGNVPSNLDDIDLSDQFGHLTGGVLSNTVAVTDGTLNIEFLSDVENPLVNGIEIIQLGAIAPANPSVSIATSQNAAEPGSNGQFAVSLSEATSTDTVVAYSVAGTATAGDDYAPLSGTVTIPAGQLSAAIDVATLDDTQNEGPESVAITLDAITAGDTNAVIGASNAATVTIADDDAPQTVGEAVLGITSSSNDVQVSTFNNNSFQITNTGEKAIAQVDIDITNALFPDTVFDPFGLAGDTISRPLTIDSNGGTGVVAPSNASNIGVGGSAGFEGLRLVFDETVNGGFESGETIGFSIDLDPNSVAGAGQGPLNAGSSPAFDVGGVSGAELIGSAFTVTFADGTTATGQLQGAGNQGGSQGLASQNSPNLAVSLAVNGLGAGEVGTYSAGGPSVTVNGPAGQTARVVLVKGFIQPTTNEFFNGNASQQAFAPTLQAQLDALAEEDFPANNAVEFQTVDIPLTGGVQDISNLFDFSGVDNFDFAGEDRLPLGFVAGVIDPDNDNLPIGPATQPIYLQFEEQVAGAMEVAIMTLQDATEPGSNGQFAVSLSDAAATDTTIAYSISGTAAPDADYTALTGTVTIPAGQIFATIDVEVLDDAMSEGSENVVVTLDAIVAGDADITVGSENTATVTIGDDDAAPQPVGGNILYRVNAGGSGIAATDGGPSFSADAPFLVGPNNQTRVTPFPAVEPGATVDPSVPGAIFDTERADRNGSGANLEYAFPVPAVGDYQVRLFVGNGFDGTSAPGQRVFDVAIEGNVPGNLDDIDLSNQFGHLVGGVLSNAVAVTDGTLNIEFLGDVENPLVNGIEIIQLSAGPTVTLTASQDGAEPSNDGQLLASLSEAADTDTVVAYNVAGTATPGDDYTPLSGTVTIPAGQLSATIDVVVLDDDGVEGPESVVVTLETIAAGDTDIVIGGANVATVAIADDDTPEVEGILYRINAGGPEIAATDGGPSFAADTPFLVSPVSETRVTPFPAVEPGVTVDPSVPGVIFDTERADFDSNGGNLEYAFPVPDAGDYQVRLFVGNGFDGTSTPGQRVFDVAIEDNVPNNLNDIDLSSQFGHLVGGVLSNTVAVTDGTLNIEFLSGVENPLVNGIEIVRLGQ